MLPTGVPGTTLVIIIKELCYHGNMLPTGYETHGGDMTEPSTRSTTTVPIRILSQPVF